VVQFDTTPASEHHNHTRPFGTSQWLMQSHAYYVDIYRQKCVNFSRCLRVNRTGAVVQSKWLAMSWTVSG